MQNASNRATYQLYLDATRDTVWGDNTNSSSVVSGVGTGSAQDLTIYGRLRAQPNVVRGSYTDTVTVTVSY